MDPAKSPRIALVAEGPSDHAVLANFLGAYFKDPDIDVSRLQPPPNVPGGWTEVLRYIASPEFAAAFTDNDYVVVQIDTDVCEEPGFGVPRRGDDGQEPTPDAIADRVHTRLMAQLSPEVVAAHADRILFAICVDSLECWLLPLVYDDRRQARTVNCLGALNHGLSARHRYAIDPAKKQVAYYERLLRDHRCHKHATLTAIADRNPSLARFIAQLDARFPAHIMLARPGA